MDRAPYRAVPPNVNPTRVLAALGPQVQRLAAERAQGAHPYFVPPEHTRQARELLGSDRLLVVEQAIVLETDPGKARRDCPSAHLQVSHAAKLCKQFAAARLR